MTAPFGLYLHFPFCLSKCRYCDFASRPAAPGEVGRYLEALRREIAASVVPGGRRPASTIYLGGGTPTLLEAPQLGVVLGELRAAHPPADGAEVTIEANPGTVSARKAAALAALGVNRVSLGVQSFDDAQLRGLGRTHSAAEAEAAFGILRRAGFGNVGIDLIHSLPGQRPAAWRRDLARAVALAPEHLSLYALTLEPGTPLARERDRGALPLPSEEEELEMLADAREMTAAAGYERYEVSSFARPGFRSRHNTDTWSLAEYRGFGAAAHSFRRLPAPERTANAADIAAYTGAVLAGRSPVAHRETVPPLRLAGEALMLALRTRDGVDAAAFAAEHGAPPAALFPGAARLGAARGWLEEAGGRLRLTEEGILLSNQLFRLLF
jgi:oxygen-independent coproporphyrinogen-3 oxidase